MCIIWCLIANTYSHKILQPEDITYPIHIQKDIKQFKKINDTKINVFEYDGNYTELFDKNNIRTLYNTSSRNKNIIN